MRDAQQAVLSLLVALLVAVSSTAMLAAEKPLPAPAVGDEIVITAQPSLFELREKVSEAEDAMFKLFNELNSDDRYDMHCSWQIRNFSHVKEKRCLPEYALQAERDQGAAFVTGVQSSPPASFTLSLHNPVMAEKIEQTARANPEFMQALIRHYELNEQLEYSRKQVFKDEDE